MRNVTLAMPSPISRSSIVGCPITLESSDPAPEIIQVRDKTAAATKTPAKTAILFSREVFDEAICDGVVAASGDAIRLARLVSSLISVRRDDARGVRPSTDMPMLPMREEVSHAPFPHH